jgi:hypothetical protein
MEEDDTIPPAPWCDIAVKSGNGYTLDVSLIVDTFVIEVPAWNDGLGGPRPGDLYTVYFNDYIFTQEEVADEEQAQWNPYRVPFHVWEVPNGSYNVYYTLWDQVQSNPKRISKTYPLTITGSKAVGGLPAPTFPKSRPDPGNGQQRVEYFADIMADGGVAIEATYNVDPGDKVTFCWFGYDMNGDIVPQSKCVIPGTIAGGTAYATIPARHVLCLGPDSNASAYYHVERQPPNGDPTDSATATLGISFENIVTLEANVAQGAPAHILGTSFCGRAAVRVFGSPGKQVDASLPGDSRCTILEATQSDKRDHSLTLDEYGIGLFHVVPNDQYGTTVTLADDTFTSPPLPVQFSDAQSDSNDSAITAYTYTTGAAANSPMFQDVSVCSIYAKVDRSVLPSGINTLEVTVGGRARLFAFPGQQTASVPIDDDGTVAVDVIDSFVETVQVSIGVAGYPAIRFPIEFAAFPSWRKPSDSPA